MNPSSEIKTSLSRVVLSTAALLACAAPAHAGLLANGSFETLAFADGVNCPGVPLGQSCVARDSDSGSTVDGLKVGSFVVKGNEGGESGSDVGLPSDLTVAFARDPFGSPGTAPGAMDAAGLVCAADPSACRDKVYGYSSGADGTGGAGSAVVAGGGAGVVAGAASSAFNLGFMQSVSGVQVSSQYGVSFLQASTQTAAKVGDASGSSGVSGASTEQWQVTYGSSSPPAAAVTSVEGSAGWSTGGMQFSTTSSAQLQTYMASGPAALLGGGAQVVPMSPAPFGAPEPSALLLVFAAMSALWLQRRRQTRLS